MERQYSIAQIREIITPIAIKHGEKSVSLFGSRARRTGKIDGDIDLIIEKGRLVSLYDLSGFRLAAEDAFQLPVDLVTTECSDREFLDEIAKESVLLYREPWQEDFTENNPVLWPRIRQPSAFIADQKVFEQDIVLQDACCMCVVQIGELAGELSDEAKALAPDIPWRLVKDTRNFYVHAYGAIDLKSVWATLNENLPQLKASCKKILENE